LARVRARVLTWNLKHGRAVPSAGRDLFDDFALTLARWAWDVALLQEVPPWWPSRLGSQLGADWRMVLTSRNLGLPMRRALAVRWPDAIKSNGGGANAVLVRTEGGLSITAHGVLRLTWLPERRWLIAVRISGPESSARELWVGNVHLTGGHRGAAMREAAAAADAITGWAGGDPIVLGGDFNLRSVSLPGFETAVSFDVDHVLVRGLEIVGEPGVLDRGRLSDHTPVAVTVAPSSSLRVPGEG
jgi:endonuclease/exonuclease/phosphatase family metal-dependent hydrolase